MCAENYVGAFFFVCVCVFSVISICFISRIGRRALINCSGHISHFIFHRSLLWPMKVPIGNEPTGTSDMCVCMCVCVNDIFWFVRTFFPVLTPSNGCSRVKTLFLGLMLEAGF